MAAESRECRSATYSRRHPEQTVLYRVVQQHLETYLLLAHEGNWDGHAVPAYVERDFRHYLECGILAYGFARAYCAECGHDFLVAFSCKGRGVCPSCNARRMAETAAHLVDHVFPPLPVRQWVLSLPKRLRYFLKTNPAAVSAVLHILLRVIQQELIKRCPNAPGNARLGAVSFIHRFGDALNEHIHFHCCVIDALFYLMDGELRTSELPALSKADIAAIQTRVSQRVLRWFVRRGWLDPDDARAMREWHNDGGFSLDASVRIPAWDRAGLERLLRYCARPPFALERLEAIDDEHLRYRFTKPQADGTTELQLTPLELIDRIAALVLPPRVHRHRYHGVLAPNSPLRAQVTALARDTATDEAAPEPDSGECSAIDQPSRSPARYLWATLIARLFELFPLTCPDCGADMKIIAFVIETPSVRAILEHIGEPTSPPAISPARGPPAWGEDTPVEVDQDYDPLAQPEPEVEFDQRVQW